MGDDAFLAYLEYLIRDAGYRVRAWIKHSEQAWANTSCRQDETRHTTLAELYIERVNALEKSGQFPNLGMSLHLVSHRRPI